MLASQSLDTGDGIFLPTTYQRVEYILSDGSQVIHIPTAFTNGTTVEMIAMQSSDDDNTSRLSLLCPDYGNNPYGYVSCYNFKWELGSALVDANLLSTEKNTIIFSRANDTNYLTIGNYSTSSAFDSGSLGDIYLFGKSGGYSLIKAYLWDMSIYQNDTLVNHLIPCYRKNDNTPGLYDVIEKQFIPVDTSAGTFTVGPDIITRSSYIQFVDPVVEKICATNWGDGIGITKTQATAVTSLSQKFRENTSITKFPELVYFTSLTEINSYDFYQCLNLAEVGFPPNATNIVFRQSPLTAMYVTGSLDKYLARETQYAFEGTPGIHLYLNGVEVTQITFPQSITTIKNNVLYSHVGITSIIIPDTVTSIGEEAFSFCTSLTSILVPGVATLMSTFFGCTSLANVVIKEGMITIGRNTFRRCSNLVRLELPSTITSIDTLALAEISHLTIIIKAQIPPTLASNVWNITTIDAIYVPYSADHSILDAYKVAQTWSDNASVIHELNPDGTIPTL